HSRKSACSAGCKRASLRQVREVTMLARAIRRVFVVTGALAAAQIVFAVEAPAQPDAVAAFYRGRTVQAVLGSPPGPTFELSLRMVPRHLGRHIPGNPTIVVQHMPGAGSLKATAYLATVAPKDGSVIGIINPVTTIDPLIDPANSKFDARAFMW